MRILKADAGIGRCCGYWELIGDIWISSELTDADKHFRVHKVFLTSEGSRTWPGPFLNFNLSDKLLLIRVPPFNQKCLWGVALLEFTVSSGLEAAYKKSNL